MGSAPLAVPPTRQLEGHAGATFRRRLDLEASTDEQRPFAHAADPPILDEIVGQPRAVVLNLEPHMPSVDEEIQMHAGGIPVAERVRQSLLGDPVDGELRGPVEPGKAVIQRALDSNPRALFKRMSKGVERLRQTKVVEDARS